MTAPVAAGALAVAAGMGTAPAAVVALAARAGAAQAKAELPAWWQGATEGRHRAIHYWPVEAWPAWGLPPAGALC
jgi:hypothetical protein